MEGESGRSFGWGSSSSIRLEDVEEDEELQGILALPTIPQPETPKESMEFLSRSWSLSTSEISKALSQKKDSLTCEKFPAKVPEMAVAPQHLAEKVLTSINSHKTGSFGKWLHHRESHGGSIRRKEKARVENAHAHSALSIAGLAAGLAAVTAAQSSNFDSKMSSAMATATELLASHCVELAELAGADHNHVASVVRSAVDIHNPSDLVTLTAAAATALRGEAALKMRRPREARKVAAVSPYDRGLADAPTTATGIHHDEECGLSCEGDLLQHTQKGGFHSKHISVYVNKRHQVILKIKNKHIGGAFSTNSKCVIYGICDETSAWPYRKERDNTEDVYFGLKTAHGLLEFKCKNKTHKQSWVDSIQNLLRHGDWSETSQHFMEQLKISNKS